jgi:hypothetical protein
MKLKHGPPELECTDENPCGDCKKKAALTAESKAPPETINAAASVEIGQNGILLRSLDDLLRFARMAVKGGAAPKAMSEGAAAIAIQAGLERGLGLLGGLQQCVVINGVLSWRGQGAFALIQNSAACKPGSLRFWTEGEGENMKGIAVAHRVGYKEADRREFSVKDAKQARLWGKGGPWTEYPKRQLAWRALGFLARDVFPDVLGGFPLAEEAADYAPIVNEKPPIQAKAELPPPSGPDPLLAALSIAPEGEGKEAAIEVKPEPKEEHSHEEADKELAMDDKQLELTANQ